MESGFARFAGTGFVHQNKFWTKPGGEGGIAIRTRMTQFLIVGLIHQDWSAGAEVVHPFKLGVVIIREKRKPVKFKVLRNKHLLETALCFGRPRKTPARNESIESA